MALPLLAPKPPPVEGAWAIPCMVLASGVRGRGLAHSFFRRVLADLRRRGARHVFAFAHRLGPGYSGALAELPESLCLGAGMNLVRDDRECPFYGLALRAPPPRPEASPPRRFPSHG